MTNSDEERFKKGIDFSFHNCEKQKNSISISSLLDSYKNSSETQKVFSSLRNTKTHKEFQDQKIV